MPCPGGALTDTNVRKAAMKTFLLPLQRNTLIRALAAFAGGILASCEAHVHHSSPPPPPPPIVYSEGEPNDHAWYAPWFGSFHPGDGVLIEGWSTDDGSDPQDGLAFTAFGPCLVDFVLYVDDPYADLDVWLYDPQHDVFLAAFDAPFGNEKGLFRLDGVASDFHLVVLSAYGSSHWTLDVFVTGAPDYDVMAQEPSRATPERLGAYLKTSPDDSPVASPALEIPVDAVLPER
jgi:hypothetical protein